MRDSKPQHKSLKLTRTATNRNNYINEASKPNFAKFFFKVSYHSYTQGMLFNGKICFIVFNKRNYDELFCSFKSYNETVLRTTSTNLPIWYQQTTKTALKCDTESFGPVSHLCSVNHKYMQYSKPQHNFLKVTRNETNRDKHIMEASKQSFVNNLFK